VTSQASAQAGSPDIRGLYDGSGSLTLTDCTIPQFNVTAALAASIDIPSQPGQEFTGTMSGSLSPIPASIAANLAGTVASNGAVTGTFTVSIVVHIGNLNRTIDGSGTFTGQSQGNTLSLSIDGQATSGETCKVKGSATFSRETTTLAAAVLPSSRSVQAPVGTPGAVAPQANSTATAFATVANAGSTSALGCSIAPATIVPANFFYQTTDPATNQLAGTPNTPADIPSQRAQTFVFSFTPTSAFPATNVQLNFSCANAASAAPIEGVNTLLLSASTTPVADVVALVATPFHNDGIADIPGNTGTGFFAVASVNVGASASVTVSANTGNASLPVNLLVCQTNPVTGACLATLGTSVTTQINSGETPTFAVFITGIGFVPFDPANNRAFVVFKGPGGATVGSTSVALRTVATP
jgi:hypothetical protein